jgi:nickel/cobalt exporter
MEFILLAASSLALGALHALEPGHGKTVVGAYLIGSQGRPRDAVLLGLVVTLTHSGSVILLGVLSAVAAAIFVPETVQRVLEVVSGVLVLGVGGWMLLVRVREWRRPAHDGDHSHSHEHGPDDHSHAHPARPAPGERPTLGQLIALGVSGGIVPCPAALAVLLAATSYGQVGRALVLVAIFSVGMAAVLVAIGLLMVRAADLAGRYVGQGRWTAVLPVVSAALITLVGVGLTARGLWVWLGS